MNEKNLSSLAPVELEFRITSEDSAILTEEAVARSLLNHDRRILQINKIFGGLAYALLAGAPILAMLLLYFFDTALEDLFGPRPNDTQTKTISFSLAALIYWPLWWRYRKILVNYLNAHLMRRNGQRVRRSLVRILHRLISGNLKRIEGLHHVRIDHDGLRLKGPRGERPVHVYWQKVTRIVDAQYFYKIHTTTTQRFGFCYLVAKQSDEMDVAAYQAGLRFFLEMSPVKPVADWTLTTGERAEHS